MTKPLTQNKVRLSKSSIGSEEKKAVMRVLDSEFLGMGKEVGAFENEIQAFLKTDNTAICVNTGTAALHLAMLCLDIGPGDEVLVPSLTYVASYQAISATGATPVSCDVTPDTLYIDSKDAKKRITSKTKAVMPVHYGGSCKGLDDVYSLASEFNLRVIEDAAHAFGTVYKDTYVGAQGDIVCFSFDGIKNITSGEGGCILTSDQALIQRLQDARLLGVERDSEARYKHLRSWNFDVSHQGLRYHMSNIMAAIGREQLKKIFMFSSKRQAISKKYVFELSCVSEIQFLDFDFNQIVSHIFVIKIKNGKRDGLREHLIKSNIECGIHYPPNHLLSKYKSDNLLPESESAYQEILTLPCHYDFTDIQQDAVITAVKNFFIV